MTALFSFIAWTFATLAHAEGSLGAQTQLLLLPHTIAILSGRPVEDKELDKNYPYLAMMRIGENGLCTVIRFKDCGISAGHCLDKKYERKIQLGSAPEKTDKAYEMGTPVFVGGEKRTKGDLAVFKIKDLDAKFTKITFDSLFPTAQQIEKLHNGQICQILGYGSTESKIKRDGSSEDSGEGTLNVGDARYEGRCAHDGGRHSGDLNYLDVIRDPSVGVEGDSGGPLVCFGKIFGVLSKRFSIIPGSDNMTTKELDELKAKYKDKLPQSWTRRGTYSSFPDSRADLQKAAQEAGCEVK